MKRQIDEHLQAAGALTKAVPLLESMVQAITKCLAGGGRVYLIGNGGSAADAQHIAAEFLGRFKLNRKALAAMALTTDTSTLTAVGNDFGGEVIFSRQVEALVTDRDILWALSVSGSSPNILAAVRAARERGARIIGFTGRRGAALAGLCDLCLQVEHEQSDRVQEVHALAYHLICEQVELAAAGPGPAR